MEKIRLVKQTFLLLTVTVILLGQCCSVPQLDFNLEEKSEIPTAAPGNSQSEGFEKIWEDYHRVRFQPRHVHLAYGDQPDEIVVTWSTRDDTDTSAVEYGIDNCEEARVNGTSTLFKDPDGLNYDQYIHHVKVTGITAGQLYLYHCGGDQGWSAVFTFTAMPNGTNWSPRLALYGDMGNENAQSLPRLQREVQNGMYDAIIHVGDFAYDLDSDSGLVGDSFMEQIETIAAYVPYMTCPGNHEQRFNFSHYKNRFSMPGPHESMMYSWNLGPIHFVSISTEYYYFLRYGIKQAFLQFEWLREDLQEANKPENRQQRPWIILYGHRPMYCSNNNTADCTNYDALTRVGIPVFRLLGLEDLLMEYGVDLAIWAHQHSYERMLPMYNYQVYNGSREHPYTNPKAPVHITTGSAGCSEKHAYFGDEKPAWTAFRSTDYGYSRLQAVNKTHLYFEQVSDDQDGAVIDAFYLIRDQHKAFCFPEN